MVLPVNMNRSTTFTVSARHRGFSLIELLIAMVIAALLMLITTNLAPVLDQSKSRQVSDSLRAHIAQTRSESISRGGNVHLCGSANATTCGTSLSGGWIVYYDADNDGTLGSADSILSRYSQDSTRLSVTATDNLGASVGSLGFDYRGYPSQALTLAVSSGDYSHTVSLYANGRVALQ
jgi:prepilin-type N-terminal cleavage/methylation domain-containing protein